MSKRRQTKKPTLRIVKTEMSEQQEGGLEEEFMEAEDMEEEGEDDAQRWALASIFATTRQCHEAKKLSLVALSLVFRIFFFLDLQPSEA